VKNQKFRSYLKKLFMRTEHLSTSRPATGDSHQPTSTGLSDKAFYLIALALLLKKSAEPGTWQRYLVPAGQPVPRG
jgi:hypothetical protein